MHGCSVMPNSRVLQAPLSTAFPRQEYWTVAFPRQKYWSELHFPTPGDLLDPGIEPESPVSPQLWVGSLPLSHLGSPHLLYK